MTGVAAVDQRRARSAGEDALLLLRPAVRHPAQGPRQRGDRLRAVGGVPVQSRHALSEGREALPAGLASRSADDGAAARHRRRRRASARCRTTRRSTRVAAEIGRIQQAYGAGAIGVLGGASLTTEKTYLLGKFARVCLKTPFIDYNGRLCMVSAGAANKKAFGIDRTTNPWSDMVGTDVIWVAGSNVAECSPITTNYIWQAREQGAKIIVQDPRITPVARTCDLYLPVKPGRDAALFAGVLQIMIERDWLDHAFIDAHTVGFEQVAEYCREWTLPRTAEVTGVPQRALMQAAEWWGTAKTSFLFHARGIEHHSNGVQNCARHDQPRARVRPDRQAEERLRHHRRPGQRPGRPRARAEVRSAARAGATSATPNTAATSPASGASTSRSCPGPGVDAYEMFRKIDRGEIKGLLSICFNPKVSLPDNAFVTRCLEKLEFYAAIDFFLNDTAWHADIVLPGSLQEEDEGTVTQVEGRIIKINKAVDCPGEAREDWRIIQDIAQALGRPHGFTFDEPARDLRGAARRQQGRRRRLLRRHLREDHAADGRVLAVLQRGPADRRAARRPSGHAAAVRAGQLQPGRQGQRAVLLPGRPRALQRRRLSAAGRRCERRVSDLPDHRPRGQPVPVGHADAPHRAAGQAVPGAADRDASAAGGEARDRRRRLGDGRDAARQRSRSGRRS